MKKITLFFAIFSFFSTRGLTQQKTNTLSLQGTIIDKKTNQPLLSATIEFPDLNKGTVSNQHGKYSISNLPSKKVLVQVRYFGYKTIIETIDLSVINQKDFQLEESVKEIKELVITGSSHAVELSRNPIPMVAINHQYLTQNASTNIIDAIAKVPGVSAVSTGPNVSKPFIHGLGYNRILTLFDGVRQEGQQWGDEHGVEIDANMVDRIEIVKGPASLIYGSDALAGVVNLLPERPAHLGELKASLQADFQSNNGLLGSSASISGNKKGVIFSSRISHTEASNYRNKIDGRVYGTGFKLTNFNTTIGINKKWGYSFLNFSIFNNQQEIPDGSRDSLTRKFTKQISEIDTLRPIVSEVALRSYRISPIHQHIQHYRCYLKNNFLIGKSSLAVNIGFQQSIRQEFSHPTQPTIAGLDLRMKSLTYDIKFSFPEKNGLETTLGINGMYQKNISDYGTDFVIPTFQLIDFGPFVFVKKNYKKIDFLGGVRFDVRSFNNQSMFTAVNPTTGFDMVVSANDSVLYNANHTFEKYKNTFHGFSGSAGITYNFNEHFSLKANVSRGYRAPSITEISANGIHPGTGFLQLGNDNFKPEFSLQEDMGFFFQNEHISVSTEFFNNQISNYIFDEKLINVAGTDSVFQQGGINFPVYKFRQTKAHLYGGEIDIDIHPHPYHWLHFENSVSMVYAINEGGNGATINDSNKYLPFIPPVHTNSELRAEFKKNSMYYRNVFVKIGMQYFASQNRAFLDYNTETITPSYLLFDAGMGVNITNKKGAIRCKITLLGTNITNRIYQSNMSRLKYMDNYPNNSTGRSGIYNMGRNICLKIIFPFELK